MTITKKQRKALKRVYDRTPLYWVNALEELTDGNPKTWLSLSALEPARVTYRQFRKAAQVSGDGTVMIHWCGMWLGIEKDGYTHS